MICIILEQFYVLKKQLYKLNVEREVNYFLLFELTTIIVIREKKRNNNN